jgi:hypothetical protein
LHKRLMIRAAFDQEGNERTEDHDGYND